MKTMKTLTLVLLLLSLVNPVLAGIEPPPQPPAENPNPPVTSEDKARVAFAELAIRTLLMTSADKMDPLKDKGLGQPSLNITRECLNSRSCLKENKQLADYVNAIKSQYGVIGEYRLPHIVPLSFKKFKAHHSGKTSLTESPTHSTKGDSDPIDNIGTTIPSGMLPDEYLIHSFVVFKKVPGSSNPEWTSNWYHLDVIVTEDEKGELRLRRFYLIGLSRNNQGVPDGMTCSASQGKYSIFSL